MSRKLRDRFFFIFPEHIFGLNLWSGQKKELVPLFLKNEIASFLVLDLINFTSIYFWKSFLNCNQRGVHSKNNPLLFLAVSSGLLILFVEDKLLIGFLSFLSINTPLIDYPARVAKVFLLNEFIGQKQGIKWYPIWSKLKSSSHVSPPNLNFYRIFWLSLFFEVYTYKIIGLSRQEVADFLSTNKLKPPKFWQSFLTPASKVTN